MQYQFNTVFIWLDNVSMCVCIVWYFNYCVGVGVLRDEWDFSSDYTHSNLFSCTRTRKYMCRLDTHSYRIEASEHQQHENHIWRGNEISFLSVYQDLSVWRGDSNVENQKNRYAPEEETGRESGNYFICRISVSFSFCKYSHSSSIYLTK